MRDAKEICPDIPIAVYQVSGEYSMLWHASEKHVVDLKAGVLESLESAVRAGATILITYYTPWILGKVQFIKTLEWMKEERN